MMVVCIFNFHFCDIAEVAIIHNMEFESRKKEKLSHFWLPCSSLEPCMVTKIQMLEIKLQLSLESCIVPKIQVLEVKLHMPLDFGCIPNALWHS